MRRTPAARAAAPKFSAARRSFVLEAAASSPSSARGSRRRRRPRARASSDARSSTSPRTTSVPGADARRRGTPGRRARQRTRWPRCSSAAKQAAADVAGRAGQTGSRAKAIASGGIRSRAAAAICCSACATSAALWQRVLGRLAMSFATSSAISAGIVGDALAHVGRRRVAVVERHVAGSNGKPFVSRSKNVTPSA